MVSSHQKTYSGLQHKHLKTQEERNHASTHESKPGDDRADPVPDEVYDEAARYYDEQGLAVLILMIAIANLLNRLHVSTRQVAGSQSWELLIPVHRLRGENTTQEKRDE
jgi:hypothetical protein